MNAQDFQVCAKDLLRTSRFDLTKKASSDDVVRLYVCKKNLTEPEL